MKLLVKNGYLTLNGKKFDELDFDEKEIFNTLLKKEKNTDLEFQNPNNFKRDGLSSGIKTKIENNVVKITRVMDTTFDRPIHELKRVKICLN